MTELTPSAPPSATRYALCIRIAYVQALLAVVMSAGCFSEQSYPMQTQDVQRIRPMEPAPAQGRA